jgi:urea transport system permease protein
LTRLPLLAVLILFGTVAAFADDAEIRQDMLRLADDDAAVRRDAIQALGHAGDQRLVSFFQAYEQGSLYLWNGQLVLCERFQDGKAPLSDPLTREPLLADGKGMIMDSSELRDVSPGRKERRLVSNVLRLLEDLSSPDSGKRLAAVRAARESILLIRLSVNAPGQTPEGQLAAARELGEMHSARGSILLQDLLKDSSLDSATRETYEQAVAQIERYQFWVGVCQDLFNGLSLGSILILMALGLSIIFGQMGVINMAHGELMMIGAYATYEMQLLFGHAPPDQASNWYYVAALPAAFMSAAFVGYLMERLVVRHLYGRPLDSLLATWCVGLFLIQAIRVKYGDNIGVNSPTWLEGNFQPVQYLSLTYSRCFIMALCALCVLSVYRLINHTRVGLLIRATVQGREMANSLGVNTRRTDGYTFALGSGLAGIAGYALTLIGGVTPDMGQNYIVDSFLVVVTGGVGIAGSVLAGLGIGMLNKILEPLTFGNGLFVMGLMSTSVCWIVLTVRAFRHDAKWGLASLLLPIPAPGLFAVKHWSRPLVSTALTFYVVGVVAIAASLVGDNMVAWFGQNPLTVTTTEILAEPIQAIWSKVLILICVVVFIQWRPMGLFPPKGRLANV